MKSVSYIRIGTKHFDFHITLPNVALEEAGQIIFDARSSEDSNITIFSLGTENLHIEEPIICIQHYVKEENYAWDTPTIRIQRMA